jgi:hypothetical protein
MASSFEGEQHPDRDLVGTGEVRMVDVDQQISGQDMTFRDEEDFEDGDQTLERITDFVLTITD